MSTTDRETDIDARPVVIAGVLALAAPILLNISFLLLAASFDYPAVLDESGARQLRDFQEHATTISWQFGLLALSAALLAPLAIYLGRYLGTARLVRASVYVGIGAAAVQVIGLLRWPIFVPGLADTATDAAKTAGQRTDAVDTFNALGGVLGTAVGETLGYVLTAAWTVLVIMALRERGLIGTVRTILGSAAAVLIVLGVLAALGAPGADVAVFVGYILWSVWLIALGVTLLRTTRATSGQAVARVAL
jgi:hypothetical protein